MNLQEILHQASERWRSCSGEGSAVLRLAILRDLYRQLHSLKSHVLAGIDETNLQILDAWTERVRALKSSANFEKELTRTLDPAFQSVKTTRIIPQEFFDAVPELPLAKFDRKDRDWEKAIAAESLAHGWSLWRLDASIPLKEAEHWHQLFIDQLWPDGVFLFAEAADTPSPTQPTSTWHGRWLFTLRPGITPQIRTELPTSWTELFPRTNESVILAPR